MGQWLKQHWKLLTGLVVAFVVGAGVGANGQESETVTTTGTTTVTSEVEADAATVTETTTRIKIKTVVKQPPSSGVKISYGDWKGLFRITGAHVVNDFSDHALVRGQFTYLGGGDCPLDYVEVEGTFFGRGNRIVGTGLWNSTTAPKGAGLPMEVSGSTEAPASRAEIVVTAANCK